MTPLQRRRHQHFDRTVTFPWFYYTRLFPRLAIAAHKVLERRVWG